jgi:transcriptional regulator with XRE-family HTH domain
MLAPGRYDAQVTNDALRTPLGRKLLALRKARGWTQRELAERAGLHVTTVIYLEGRGRPASKDLAATAQKARGQAPAPSAATLGRLAAALECGSQLDEFAEPGAEWVSVKGVQRASPLRW